MMDILHRTTAEREKEVEEKERACISQYEIEGSGSGISFYCE